MRRDATHAWLSGNGGLRGSRQEYLEILHDKQRLKNFVDRLHSLKSKLQQEIGLVSVATEEMSSEGENEKPKGPKKSRRHHPGAGTR